MSEVARRHDLTPQHLFSWIKAAKAGRVVLRREEPEFVPVVASEPPVAPKSPPVIEVAIGAIVVRVPSGADARTVDAVLRAVKRVAL